MAADNAAAFAGLSTSLGVRLGLYRAMAGAGPLTSTELAKRTGLVERYVREWLDGQVAGSYVIHSPETNTYLFPGEHAAVLADSSLPTYVGGDFTMLKDLCGAEEALANAYRNGGGVSWQDFGPDLAEGMARSAGPSPPPHPSCVCRWPRHRTARTRSAITPARMPSRRSAPRWALATGGSPSRPSPTGFTT
ncbi:hypothetical protein AB0N16_18645 [Streptomyces sp. NPDC051105]|uniref:hypothetical protein n=1 Tax=Streptomyces sp. NPDC051105 TaxID=3154843 RepID=UPI003413AD4A